MKIKEIKIVNQDQSTEIANIGADAINVDYNDTTVKAELDKLNNDNNTNKSNITNLQSQVSSLASGGPAGGYATVAALTAADPDHSKIYVVAADGHWYYYNSGWKDGGLYQATEIAENSIDVSMLNDNTINLLKSLENLGYNPQLINNKIRIYVKSLPIYSKNHYVSDRTLNLIADPSYDVYKFDFNKFINYIEVGYITSEPLGIMGIVSGASSSYSAHKLLVNMVIGKELENGFALINRQRTTNKGYDFIDISIYPLLLPNSDYELFYLQNNVIKSNCYFNGTGYINIPNWEVVKLMNNKTYYLDENYRSDVPGKCFNSNNEMIGNITIGLQNKIIPLPNTSYMYINMQNTDYIYSNKYEAINNSINNITNNISSINKFIEINSNVEKPFNFSNKNIAFFGDSITQGTYTDEDGTPHVGNQYSFARLLANKLGFTDINKGIGGSTIATGYAQAGAISTKLINELPSLNCSNVFISGGTNDYNEGVPIGNINSNDTSTFFGALNSMVSVLNTKFKNPSDIIFLSPINRIKSRSIAGPDFIEYSIALFQFCSINGYSFIDCTKFGFPTVYSDYSKKILGDNLHPTLKGYQLMLKGLLTELV